MNNSTPTAAILSKLFWKYLWRIIKGSWHGSEGVLKLVEIFVFVAVYVFGFFYPEWKPITGIICVVLFCVLIGTFLLGLIATAYWFGREQNEKIDSLTRKLSRPRLLGHEASEAGTGLTILHACFGIGPKEDNWIDVTQQIKRQVSNGRLEFATPLPGDALASIGFTDPAPNQRKQLVILYSTNGIPKVASSMPEEKISLP